MNDLPTVFEVVSGGVKKERDRYGTDNSGRNKLSAKQTSEPRLEKNNAREPDEGYDEDDGNHSETLCRTCGGIYSTGEFWIGCDVCEKCYHGKCVKITPAKAESIKQYKCPSCCNTKDLGRCRPVASPSSQEGGHGWKTEQAGRSELLLAQG